MAVRHALGHPQPFALGVAHAASGIDVRRRLPGPFDLGLGPTLRENGMMDGPPIILPGQLNEFVCIPVVDLVFHWYDP